MGEALRDEVAIEPDDAVGRALVDVLPVPEKQSASQGQCGRDEQQESVLHVDVHLSSRLVQEKDNKGNKRFCQSSTGANGVKRVR